MKKELLAEIFDKYGLKATAHDAITYIMQHQLISPTSVRNLQIQNLYNELRKKDPERTKTDIIDEISFTDYLGRPSTSTIRKVLD